MSDPMRIRRQIGKDTSSHSLTPARNPFKTRGFGNGMQARSPELPTTNLLQKRPVTPPTQQSSQPQETSDLQTQLKQGEQFGYNAANIPLSAPKVMPSAPIQAKLMTEEPIVQRKGHLDVLTSNTQIQRVLHTDIGEGSKVKFNTMVVLKGDRWVEPGTMAEITNAPGGGDVKAKILTGSYTDDIVEVNPKYLDLDQSIFGNLPQDYRAESDPNKQNLLKNKMEAIKILESKRKLLGSEADEIKQSILTPEKIDQAQFNFCGPNDFLMAIAFNDPVSYVKYIIDLYTAKKAYEEATTSGQTIPSQTAQLGSMQVNVDPGVATTDATMFQSTGVSQISQTDWMSMGSIRTQATDQAPDYSKDSDVMQVVQAFQNGGVQAALGLQPLPTSDTLQKAIMVIKQSAASMGDTLQALAQAPQLPQIEELRKVVEGAMPSEVAAWFTQYGANNIVQQADPFSPTKSDTDIQNANSCLDASQGKMVMLNINAETIQGNHSSVTQFDPASSHWVLMKTPLVKNTGVTPNVWEGTVYSWGGTQDLKIDDNKIGNSFFGFVAATITTPQSSFQL